MANFTTYALTRQAQYMRGTQMPTPPTWYMGLFSSAPTVAGGGTEFTTGTAPNYSRPTFAFGAESAGSGGGVQVLNSAEILFPNVVTSAWPAAAAWGLFDASTVGNLWLFGTLVDAAGTTITPAAQIDDALRALSGKYGVLFI